MGRFSSRMAFALWLSACAHGEAPSTMDAAPPSDFSIARSPDLAPTDGGDTDQGPTIDLAGADANAPDLAVSGDLATRDGPLADLATPRDLAPSPDLAQCSLLPQSGCMSGQKCSLVGTANTCEPDGTVTNGQKCFTTGTDDCRAGELCTSDAPAPAPAICRVFCNSDGDCKQPAVASGSTPEPMNVARCAITITGTSAKVCTYACNPVSAAGASGCVSGQGCAYFVLTGGVEATDCEVAGPAGNVDNFNCTTDADCAPGFTCVGPAGMTRCRQMCRNGNSNDCSNVLYNCYAPAGVTSPMFGFCCDAIAGC